MVFINLPPALALPESALASSQRPHMVEALQPPGTAPSSADLPATPDLNTKGQGWFFHLCHNFTTNDAFPQSHHRKLP